MRRIKMRELYEYFNLKIKEKVKRCPEYNKITEIRMRVNSPLIINKVNSEEVFRDVIISEDDISDTFNIVTDYSAYAFEDNIKEGFLSVPGGHRIGFGGVIVKENNRIKAIKNIKFLNIRVCRQIENYGEMLYEKTKSNEKIENILIISPPGLGKTTLLRDYIKKISNETPGTSICVIDERNEISGMYMGVPTIDLGIHGLHPELIRIIGKMKYRSSYGQNLLQHARETANLCAVMASELGLNPKKAKRAGLLHDIGKVPDEEPELPHALYGMKLAEKFKEKPDICNAIGAHHDEVEMTSLLAPIVQVCDAISGARPGARREIVEAYIKRLNDLEQLAMSYPGVTKTYAIQAGRELRVIVGADKIDDKATENLSGEIAKKIQDEMTYPGQVKITVIRETRAVSYAK